MIITLYLAGHILTVSCDLCQNLKCFTNSDSEIVTSNYYH